MNSNSKPFSINASDWIKGAFLAVIVAVLAGLQQMLTAHGLDFASYDWGMIVNLVGTAFVGYMAKQFMSDANSVPFGNAKYTGE